MFYAEINPYSLSFESAVERPQQLERCRAVTGKLCQLFVTHGSEALGYTDELKTVFLINVWEN